MLFIVIFSISVVIFTKIDGCPSQLPCITPNGTKGNCVQSRECPYIQRIGDGNLTPEQFEFVTKSVCGIDLDNSKLFCCDINEIRSLSGQITNDHFNGGNGNSKTVVIQNGPSAFSQTTVKPLETPVIYCHTPNGEKAQCISVYQCTSILRNVSSNTTENQKRFFKESRCGSDNNQSPMVCCGSDTNFREDNNFPNFRQNPLIPVGFCGLQNSEMEEKGTIPLIKQRFFQNKRAASMNFTLPNRIFGGENSKLSEFPWVALLVYENHNGQKEFACGGSLISSRYILTAAHCVTGPNVQSFASKLTAVRLGEWDYSNNGSDCLTEDGHTVCNEAELNVQIDSIHPHPAYRASVKGKFHDIALIRLKKDIKFTKYIRPICLPSIDDYIPPGERLTISGWGLINYNEATTIKQKVEVPVVSMSQCSIMFEKSPSLTRVGRGQFCAGGEAGKDSCVGDSGAPLMRKFKSNSSDPGLWYVEGIVSFGTGCGLANQYGVYTKVSEYLEWIHNTMVP